MTWISESPILKVESDGTTSYLDSGKGTIRVYTKDGNFTAACTVTVEGDKEALKAAINMVKAANIVPSDFTYATYYVFDNAYNTALNVKNGDTYTAESKMRGLAIPVSVDKYGCLTTKVS